VYLYTPVQFVNQKFTHKYTLEHRIGLPPKLIPAGDDGRVSLRAAQRWSWVERDVLERRGEILGALQRAFRIHLGVGGGEQFGGGVVANGH
jgi:hypothetical protein